MLGEVNPQGIYSKEGAAKVTGTSKRLISRAINKGELAARPYGDGDYRITGAAIVRWLECSHLSFKPSNKSKRIRKAKNYVTAKQYFLNRN